MDGVQFSNLNPYAQLEVISGRSPEDMLARLRMIRTPIKIVAIVADNGRHFAYIMGDIRHSKKEKKNERA